MTIEQGVALFIQATFEWIQIGATALIWGLAFYALVTNPDGSLRRHSSHLYLTPSKAIASLSEEDRASIEVAREINRALGIIMLVMIFTIGSSIAIVLAASKLLT